MSRDHRKLRVFRDADDLVVAVYQFTAKMPDTERFGLQVQLKRAAVSVPANIVEGSARPGVVEYCRFLNLSHSSARECEYLIRLSARLHLTAEAESEELANRYSRVAAQLLAASNALSPKP